MTVTRLHRMQAFNLYNWMARNVENFDGMTYEEVADRATVFLEFEVSKWHVKNARKDLGIDWIFKNQNQVDSKANNEANAKAMKDLADRVYAIEQYLTDLKAALLETKKDYPASSIPLFDYYTPPPQDDTPNEVKAVIKEPVKAF